MQLYRYKKLDTGFIILCPNHNVALLKNTVRGIENRYPGRGISAAVGNDVGEEELAELKKVCPIHVGRGTITSLINAGMNNHKKEWAIIVMEGSHVREGLDRKYSYFIDSPRDILFPVVGRHTNFIDGSMNGIMIHQSAWDAAGPFLNDGELDECKTVWSYNAVTSGCRFKAILGAIVC